MIDTIKLVIYREFNEEFYTTLLNASEQKKSGFIVRSTTGITQRQDAFVMKVNNFDDYEQLIINGSFKTPSHLYNIFWRCFEDRVQIEFSLPKFIYGTNSIELRSHMNKQNNRPYTFLKLAIKTFFSTIFPLHKIDYGGIELARFDFCYNQCYKNREESLKALKFIKLKHNGRADRLNFEYGYISLSKSNYFKIYHKGEEFKKHDFHKIKSEKLANQYQKLSDCILRYERKQTPKNWSYFYNINVKYRYQSELKKLYYKAKKNNRVSKQMRRDFENLQRFTLASSKIEGATKLNEDFFNLLYKRFRNEIKKKYSISKVSVHRLHNEVISNTKNKTMKVRILSLIKVFKSLKRAYESGAVSKATYYRYEKFMKQNDMSSTNVKSNIYQCWDSYNYYSALHKNLISPINLTEHCGVNRFKF